MRAPQATGHMINGRSDANTVAAGCAAGSLYGASPLRNSPPNHPHLSLACAAPRIPTLVEHGEHSLGARARRTAPLISPSMPRTQWGDWPLFLFWLICSLFSSPIPHLAHQSRPWLFPPAGLRNNNFSAAFAGCLLFGGAQAMGNARHSTGPMRMLRQLPDCDT
jgi:hypothetical protein